MNFLDKSYGSFPQKIISACSKFADNFRVTDLLEPSFVSLETFIVLSYKSLTWIISKSPFTLKK